MLAIGAGLLGLVVGSFLNVVIHRLPRMIERQWRRDCAESQGNPPPVSTDTYHLALPGSHCPHCGHTLTPWENIPVISFLWQRGRCRKCNKDISWRYPAVELLAALSAIIVANHFGPTGQMLAALGLTWTLIAASAIDLEHQLLPDILTLPLMWAGLALSLESVFVDPATAIIGAITGYIALWSVYWSFRLFTGKEGMGYGDFKLLAALGAWLGWANLTLVVLLSSLVGSIIGISLVLFGRHDYQRPLPFGPFLAAAGWIALLWGKELSRVYLY